MRVKFYKQFHNPVIDSIPESVYEHMMTDDDNEDAELDALMIVHLAYYNTRYLDAEKQAQLELEIKKEGDEFLNDVEFDELIEEDVESVEEVELRPTIKDFDSMFG